MLKVDSVMTFDVDKEIFVLKVTMATVFDHMKPRNTVVLGPINLKLLVSLVHEQPYLTYIEMHHYMLVSASICRFRRSSPVSNLTCLQMTVKLTQQDVPSSTC